MNRKVLKPTAAQKQSNCCFVYHDFTTITIKEVDLLEVNAVGTGEQNQFLFMQI